MTSEIKPLHSCRPHIVRHQGSSPIGCKLVVGRERVVDLARLPAIDRSIAT